MRAIERPDSTTKTRESTYARVDDVLGWPIGTSTGIADGIFDGPQESIADVPTKYQAQSPSVDRSTGLDSSRSSVSFKPGRALFELSEKSWLPDKVSPTRIAVGRRNELTTVDLIVKRLRVLDTGRLTRIVDLVEDEYREQQLEAESLRSRLEGGS